MGVKWCDAIWVRLDVRPAFASLMV
jgi:hypothetical protein